MDLQLNTASDFWLEVVEPDVSAFCQRSDNLRLAFHAASSLFHMADWVFLSNTAQVQRNFNWNGAPVADEKQFANAIESQFADFGRIRGIANAGKRSVLKSVRPVAGAANVLRKKPLRQNITYSAFELLTCINRPRLRLSIDTVRSGRK
jgi:hypothetical protein